MAPGRFRGTASPRKRDPPLISGVEGELSAAGLAVRAPPGAADRQINHPEPGVQARPGMGREQGWRARQAPRGRGELAG